MKRCPACRRDYYDETLRFCLDDGTQLVDGPASTEEPATARLPANTGAEAPTRQQFQTTGDTPVFSQITQETPARAWGGKAIAIAIGAILLVAAGVLAVYKYLPQRSAAPRSTQIEKLTLDGKSFNAALSPDGKYVVYSMSDGGQQSVWTKHIPTGSSVQIIPPADGVEYQGLRFAPDGNFITFVRRDIESTKLMLYQMPVLGGRITKLADDVDGPASFSPDAKQISFVRGNFPAMGKSSLLIAAADGSGQRVLAERTRPETFPWWPGSSVPWAPDGRSVAAVVGGAATGSGLMHIVEIDLSDGSIKQVTKEGWYQIKDIAWLPDKTGLLVMGAPKVSDYFTQQIILVDYPTGELGRRITSDFNDYIAMNLTLDGSSLAAVQSSRISNIWVVPGADASRAVQIKSGGNNQDGTDGLAWTPGGQIVFYSKASGADDLWSMNSDGSGVKQLTTNAGVNYDVRATPDGRYLLFTSERAGKPNIWRMEVDGRNPVQLTNGESEFGVIITNDSKCIIYDSTAGGYPAVEKMSIDGGQPVQLLRHITENCEMSPNGKLLTCHYRENQAASWRYATFAADGGDPIRIFDLPGGFNPDFRWSPDGRGIDYRYTTKGVTNIWRYPFDTGKAKPVTAFKNDQIFNFKWSPDGKDLVVARGTVMADVVMIRDFR